MTYTFKCNRCGAEFDKDFTFSEIGKVKPVCPKCKSKSTRKLINKAPQVRFVGSGFYINDKGK